MTENKVLMEKARETLKGKWGLAVGVWCVYAVISILAGEPEGMGPGLQALIEGPLLFGLSLFALSLVRGQEASLAQLFEGFKDFVRTFVAYILMCIFILLWSLLLIVPGIIAMLAYSQTFFVLVDNKTLSANEAIKKSKAMMMGHKKKLFYLWLRFLGWFALSILTMGIGFLWSLPYFYVTLAKFYEEVSKQAV